MDWLRAIFKYLPAFCFSYPFIMAWYWMAGGLFYHLWRERGFNAPDNPPELDKWPPISVLIPCFNELETAVETLTTAHQVEYPDFEIIAINDGSRDDTAEILDRLAQSLPRLKSSIWRPMAARHERSISERAWRDTNSCSALTAMR